jgi:enoyl-CoA hydratase
VSDILVERPEPEVALVTMNRPDRLNALTLEMVHDLSAALDQLDDDRTCRAVVITGAGRGFCAGHDLADLEGEMDVPGGMDVQAAFANLTVRITALSQPVIAAVNGPAAGGGLAIALGADTRVCSTSARFNAAFVRIGLSGCDVGVSYLLPRLISPTVAFEMMLTGRLIDADEALRVGLVGRVVPDGEVVDAAMAIAADICRNTPFGVRMTKQVMWANLDAAGLRQAIELENRTQILCTQAPDFHEALRAFAERRPAKFSGT